MKINKAEVNIKEETFSDIAGLRDEYLLSLRGPQEAWIEEQVLTRKISVLGFRINNERVGYCCIEKEKKLLFQFYLRDRAVKYALEVIETLIKDSLLSLAYVSTRDHLLFSLCLCFKKTVNLEAYIFEHSFPTDLQLTGFKKVNFRVAKFVDQPAIFKVSGDFYGDIHKEIAQKNLFVLQSDETILGVGYINAKYCTKNTANIGMFTNENFRKKGVGSYLVQCVTNECKKDGLKAIAGCYHKNIESRKTLEKAGFTAKDRTVIFEF